MVKKIIIKKDILSVNSEKADAIRQELNRRKILMFNIMSSPGAGKTTLLMQTISRLKVKYQIAVIEGDVASSIDTDRISALKVPAVQINTGGGCHLEANMVMDAMEKLDLNQTDLIFVENVGNLICTAEFDIGAHKNVVILSVPEGDDKPLKYPALFSDADVVLISKIDVLQYFDFNVAAFPELINGFNPLAKVFPVSAKTSEGLDKWFSWIEEVLIGF